MKSLSKRDKLKAFIVTKMIDLITFLDNNGKLDVYTGGNTNGLYRDPEMIGALTTLTTLSQRFYNFCNSYSTNNDTASLHPVIAALQIIKKSICD